jgi:hypothetical protein
MVAVVMAGLACLGAAAPAGAVSAASGPVPAAGAWGRAIAVPGLAALNTGGNAEVSVVSCASAGSCAAGGDYTDRRHNFQGFVASERRGRWGKAIGVPGLTALNKGRFANIDSVSCGAAGDCAAGGFYADRSHHQQGFVAVERHGRWGTAIGVPGLTALNKGGLAEVFSVSCASAGSCAAGGYYSDRHGNLQGFVAVERHGAWGAAIEVPGLAALNKGQAQVGSVSCASAGSCAAGGVYDSRHASLGFVASERHGRWSEVMAVPGLAALNKGDDAGVGSVSCVSAGNCAAVGEYTDRRGIDLGFVVSERHGRWGKAIALPGLAALDTGADAAAVVPQVACASAGSCVVGGNYTARRGTDQVFVAVERHGRWGKAIAVPGLAALSRGDATEFASVSCAPAGGCAAGGKYSDPRNGHGHGFVAVERDGRWARRSRCPAWRP